MYLGMVFSRDPNYEEEYNTGKLFVTIKKKEEKEAWEMDSDTDSSDIDFDIFDSSDDEFVDDMAEMMEAFGMGDDAKELKKQKAELDVMIQDLKKLKSKGPKREVDMDEAFKMSTDKNDRITVNKLIEFAQKGGEEITAVEAEALIRKADADGDNQIDRSEFDKLFSILMEDKEEVKEMKDMFRMFADEEGYITKEIIMKTILEGCPEGEKAENAQKMLDSQDGDKDGKVSYTEFLMSMAMADAL